MTNSKTWAWLTRGELKKETESLITAAQDQALRTNAVKAKIDKTRVDSKCRMCLNADETVGHVVCECSKLALRKYKARHDSVAKAVHWNLCKKFDLECKEKWYEHEPEKVIESDKVKILWDFSIQTDHVIEHRRPDLVVLDKEKKHCQIM